MADQNILQQNILQVLGLQNLPEDQKIALLENISELVIKRIIVRVIKEIKDEDREEANKVFASGTDDEKLLFMQDKVNFTQLLTEELIKVKQELMDDMKKFQ